MYSVHMPVETNSLDQKQKSRTTCNSKHIFYGPKDMSPAYINGREVKTCCLSHFLRVSVIPLPVL